MRSSIKFVAATALVIAVPLAADHHAASSDSIAAATQQRPEATIADLAWMEGAWKGTGVSGNPAGESYSRAEGDTMVGHFYQLDERGDVEFFELITIVPDGQSLTMRLKHFTADMTGWEGQGGDAAMEFPLVSRSETEWVFGPVTYTRHGNDKLQGVVSIQNADGSMETIEFQYQRVPLH